MRRAVLWQYCVLSMLAFLVPITNAADAPNLAKPKIIVPENIAGVETLSAADVVNKAQKVSNLLVIDSRIENDRLNGYIDSSISLPDTKTNCHTLAEIAGDKDRPLLFYCNGVKCGRSVVAIKIAKACGYTNISWFRGGFEEWLQSGYPYLK